MGLFLYIAVRRASYPLDLEWMEGGQLLEARQILHGRLPYGAPSAEHIALPYEPLYPALVAVLGKFAGLDLWTGRAVSIVCTVVLALAIGRATYRETHRSLRWSLVAFGFVFSLYRATGYWLDLVRVDALFLALVALMLLAAASRERLVLTLALAFLSFKAKQLAVFFVWIPAVTYMLDTCAPARDRRRRALLYLGSLIALCVFDSLLENWATGGFYLFFTFKLPQGQPYIFERIRRGLWEEAFSAIPVVMFLGSWFVVTRLRRCRVARGMNPWILAALAGVGATISAWARPGGAGNNLLTTYVFLIPPCVAQLQRLSFSLRRSRFAAVPSALVLFHFVQQIPDLHDQVPTRAERRAAEELIRFLKDGDGPLLIPEHPWYAVLAGKEPSYHACELWELAMADENAPHLVSERLKQRAYRRVIVSANDAWAPPELTNYYRLLDGLRPPVVRTYTGTTGTDPARVYVPR
jgi:hypothetical protein